MKEKKKIIKWNKVKCRKSKRTSIVNDLNCFQHFFPVESQGMVLQLPIHTQVSDDSQQIRIASLHHHIQPIQFLIKLTSKKKKAKKRFFHQLSIRLRKREHPKFNLQVVERYDSVASVQFLQQIDFVDVAITDAFIRIGQVNLLDGHQLGVFLVECLKHLHEKRDGKAKASQKSWKSKKVKTIPR